MVDTIPSISTEELSQRRTQLRQQRRIRFAQSVWRTLAIAGITGGLVWATTLPIWVLTNPKQVTIKGNELLADDTIRALLPLNYPQSLLWIHPQQVVEHLKTNAPIAWAVVNRTLVPPGLVIEVKERYPVAMALPTATTNPNNSDGVDLLDENGIAVPLERYRSVKPSFKLPTLRVIGSRDYYREHWQVFYRTIRQSEVTVTEVDWREPANVKLKTELGLIHIGAYDSLLVEQLNALARLRQIPRHVPLKDIEFIDLRNPDQPMVQLVKRPSPAPVNAATTVRSTP